MNKNIEDLNYEPESPKYEQNIKENVGPKVIGDISFL